MLYEFFQIPAGDAGPERDRFNQFLKTHRIVKAEKHFFTNGTDGYWSFCVSWLEADFDAQKGKYESRIDYREVALSSQIFRCLIAECRLICDHWSGRASSSSNRVIRGGSWINNAQNARSAYRNWNVPGNRNHNLGFRCMNSATGSG